MKYSLRSLMIAVTLAPALLGAAYWFLVGYPKLKYLPKLTDFNPPEYYDPRNPSRPWKLVPPSNNQP